VNRNWFAEVNCCFSWLAKCFAKKKERKKKNGIGRKEEKRWPKSSNLYVGNTFIIQFVHFLSRNRHWDNWQNERINLASLDLTSPDGKIFTSLGSCIANYEFLFFERVSICTEEQESNYTGGDWYFYFIRD
jgi:hypothetical protein